MAKDFSRTAIISDIRNTAKKLNKSSISRDEYRKHGNYSDGPLRRLFGSETGAFQAAGLNTYQTITDEDIISDIQQVAAKLGVTSLSARQYNECGKYNRSTVKRRLGSWSKAIQLAQLDPYHKQWTKYSDDELLQFLRRFYQQFGRPPTTRDLTNTPGYPPDKTYYLQFNKPWGEILKMAGLESSNQIFGQDGFLYDSMSEAAIADTLYKNFVNYEPHKIVTQQRKWTCDFYLPDQDTWVEYDGLGERRKNITAYQEKLDYYKKNSFNFIVVEHSEDVLEKANLYIRGGLSITSIQYTVAKEFLLRNHYLRSIPRANKFILGGFINKKLVAVCLFGKNSNPHEDKLTLSRLCYCDLVRKDKNFGSKFVSRCLKYLTAGGFGGTIVTWSDPRFHDGTLYKACNFQLTLPKTRKKDYIYIDNNGNEYHKSKCRVKSGQSEKERARELGLTKVEVCSKIRWEINL